MSEKKLVSGPHVPWPVVDEQFRRRRIAAWGPPQPVAGPMAEARTPPPEVLRIEDEWYEAFLAHPDNQPARPGV
ncbi:hypothetical protein [Micromonospora sp. CA-244673]|uniref:hypothetical protein n=1 Tax=Micromonospora sp. CA-244673 TaxID=3239958 RepID=UPI003D8ED240